jgi:hypothetical protein
MLLPRTHELQLQYFGDKQWTDNPVHCAKPQINFCVEWIPRRTPCGDAPGAGGKTLTGLDCQSRHLAQVALSKDVGYTL